jgi:hypothetical protein
MKQLSPEAIKQLSDEYRSPESKHTPGPWDAVEAEGQPQIVSRTNKLIAEVNTVVRFVYGKPDDPEADASLIAAAPEMLEALEAAQQEFLGLSSYLATCDPVTIVQNLDAIISSLKAKQLKAEAAIRKAKLEAASR